MEWYERPLRYYAGHAAESLPLAWAKNTPIKDIPAQALRGLLEFLPSADVVDLLEGSHGVTRGVLALDPYQTAEGAARMGYGILGALTAGAGSRIARGGAKAVESLAYRAPKLYNPPVKTQRPFEADYPHGAATDESGRLLHDIEGRPLTAEHVVGRQVHGGEDVALPTERILPIAERSAGARVSPAPSRALRGDAGRLVKVTDRRSGRSEYEILLDRNLDRTQVERVGAHEVSHLIDDLSGKIPTDGLSNELKIIYNDLNNPSAGGGKPVTPAALGYRGDHIDLELMAEAIRAYMADPNYVKTVAPKTAARIRKYVNENPRLNRIIQFNSLGGLGILGLSESDE